VGVVKRGENYCIRYYGPDGRQRWETIGPNRKEAETILHQRLYEVRSGIYPILRRRSRQTFRELAEEWLHNYAESHVRGSTLITYRGLLDHHLLPALGEQAVTVLTTAKIQAYLGEKAREVAPKTANHVLGLLKEILEAAVTWGRLPHNPAKPVRKITVFRREMPVWTAAEIRKFLLAASSAWRPVFAVSVFCGLRLGEVQAMTWEGPNRPNFTTNKLEVSRAYSKHTRKVEPPKSARGHRAVEMPPTVRRLLQELRVPGQGGLVFSGPAGPVGRNTLSRAYLATIARAEVSRIRYHDLRHTYASLLIAAGKHPKYIASQIGHASAAFTLDVYGHLMDRLPVRPVEWIDDLVFPEGFEAALKLHLSGALSGAVPCSPVQPSEGLEPLQGEAPAARCSPMQRDGWLGGQDSNLDTHIQSVMAYR